MVNEGKFLDEHGGLEFFVPQWRKVVKERYPKDNGVNFWHEKRLANGQQLGLDYEDLEEIHGVDFLGKVIPEMLDMIKRDGSQRKMKILDIGSGLGFFGDQVRHRFGDQVKVYGSTLSRKRVLPRKRRLMELLRNNKFDIGVREVQEILISESVSKRVLESLGALEEKPIPILHPNDAKWRSILQLSDYPEFDLEIDTCGEIYYSDKMFPQVLECAIKKLRKKGRLYIADLYIPAPDENKIDQYDWLLKNRDDLSRKHHVEINIISNDVYSLSSSARGEETTSVVIFKFQ